MTHDNPGDRWSDLVAAHSQGLFRVALQMLNDRQEAEDVVQETYLRAYVALERRGLAVHTSIKAWLGRIAINLCYDRLRKKSWHEVPSGYGSDLAVAAPALDCPFDWLSTQTESPETAALRSDQAEQIHRAVACLPPNHRAAVTLRYAYELSYREMAQVLEVPENTVATWLRRAHLAMRRDLQQEEDVRCPAAAHG